MPKSFSLKLEQEYQEPLGEVAKAAGFLWGEDGNATAMVRAIAKREIGVGNTVSLTEPEQQALLKTVRVLLAQGDWGSARSLSRFLRGEGTDPIIRTQLEVLLEPLQSASIKEVEDCIQNEKPFALSYQDAAGRRWAFRIEYAQFAVHEDRQYLDCWCQETEGNQDIPGLRHNWSLRLDRMQEASIIPLAERERWRSRLDTVEVVFDLLGGLAHAYQSWPDDQASEWIEVNHSPTRRISRKITSSFWFAREVLRYGSDCLVRSPESVRARIQKELQAACDRYSWMDDSV